MGASLGLEFAFNVDVRYIFFKFFFFKVQASRKPTDGSKNKKQLKMSNKIH